MKIAMYDLEGHLLEILEGSTYQDIIDLLPIRSNIKNVSSVQKVVKGERNFAGSYQFREVKSDRPLDKIGSCTQLKKTIEKPIHKYWKGNYITTYRNIQEASEKNIIDHSNIASCLKGTRELAGGFEWKYAY